MTDRTQHVLDAIDGALADAEFPDGMRWSPEPAAVDDAPAPFDGDLVWQPPQRYEQALGVEHRRQPGFRGGRIPPARQQGRGLLAFGHAYYLVGPDQVMPWQGTVLADVFGIAFREAAEAMARVMHLADEHTQSFAALIEQLAERPLADERPVADEDPSTRALRLRRERNTGPSRDLTRQRRPRLLP